VAKSFIELDPYLPKLRDVVPLKEITTQSIWTRLKGLVGFGTYGEKVDEYEQGKLGYYPIVRDQ